MCKNTSLFVDLYTSLEFSHQVRLRVKHTSGNQDAVTGIRRFQSFFGLPVTAELKEETLAEMRKSRCGVLDVDSDGGIMKRSPPMGYNTKKWRQTSFTYFLCKAEDLPESEQHRIIAKAFKIWSDAAPKLKFTKAKYQEWKPTDADFKVHLTPKYFLR